MYENNFTVSLWLGAELLAGTMNRRKDQNWVVRWCQFKRFLISVSTIKIRRVLGISKARGRGPGLEFNFQCLESLTSPSTTTCNQQGNVQVEPVSHPQAWAGAQAEGCNHSPAHPFLHQATVGGRRHKMSKKKSKCLSLWMCGTDEIS